MSILSKIGAFISALGIIALYCLGQAGEETAFNVALILGIINIIPGIIFGWKAIDWDISPFAAMFMSDMDFLDNRFTSAIMWAIRFFFIPAVLVFVIMLVFA